MQKNVLLREGAFEEYGWDCDFYCGADVHGLGQGCGINTPVVSNYIAENKWYHKIFNIFIWIQLSTF